MGKLWKFRNKLILLMQGRNGIDEIFKACIGIYLLLYIVNIFARSIILYLAMTGIFVYSVFRMMSRNIYKRREENARFLTLIGRVQRKFSMCKTMLTDRTKIYKRCPGCKNIMRIPRLPGEHTVKCACGRQMKIKIRGNQNQPNDRRKDR